MPANTPRNSAPLNGRPRRPPFDDFAVPMSTAAFLIAVAAYWLPFIDHIGVCSTGQYVNVARGVALGLLGFAGGIGPYRRIAPAGAIGLISAWIADVELSIYWPSIFSCSHQLLPFEAAIVMLFAFTASALGYLAGRLLSWLWPRAFRNRLFWAYALIIVASAVTLSTPILLPIELRANADRALRTVEALVSAQDAFRKSHPKIGYACHLSDISHELAASMPTVEAKRQGYEDDFSKGYRYRLWCNGRAPRASYVIEATPFCVPDCGTVYFCVDASGDVRAGDRPVPMDRVKGCWRGAAPVRAGLF